ncbi:hypothetical protein D3C78_302040 [compost metagenome]
MNNATQTPAQALEGLRQEALKLIHRFAESTRDVARFRKWTNRERESRCLELVRIIKRDLGEFHGRVQSLDGKHKRDLSSAVLTHPHHPVMLAAGGEWYQLIEDLTNVLTPNTAELAGLLAQEGAASTQTAVA